jgi:5-methyltetrahydrofolate corrinoid/iron sulfur protein methyltransferase
MPWVVQTVQEVVDDIPLALDTSNIDAIAAALKVYKPTSRAAVRSSTPSWCGRSATKKWSRSPSRARRGLHRPDVGAREGLPRDENERAALCVELLYFANEAGIPNEKIWVDGIVTPVNIQQPQLDQPHGISEDDGGHRSGAKSTCGLSNISNGPPEHLRPILNQTYMVMLAKCTGWFQSSPTRSMTS